MSLSKLSSRKLNDDREHTTCLCKPRHSNALAIEVFRVAVSPVSLGGGVAVRLASKDHVRGVLRAETLLDSHYLEGCWHERCRWFAGVSGESCCERARVSAVTGSPGW